MKIASLHAYPVKSARGISHDFAMTDQYGFFQDRSFMVVSPRTGRFITQRENPKLAALKVTETSGHLVLWNGNKFKPLRPADLIADDAVPVSYKHHKYRQVSGYDCGGDIAGFLTDFLGEEARMIWMGKDFDRTISPDDNRKVGYADGFPFLVTTTRSLDALREQMVDDGVPAIGMDRFRPNIVIDGNFPAFDEDNWKYIQLGDGGPVFELMKPCTRCEIPSTDQATGERPDKMLITNVLKCMGRFGAIPLPEGKKELGVMFGMNAALASPDIQAALGQSSDEQRASEADARAFLEANFGSRTLSDARINYVVRVGDQVTVLQRHPASLWTPRHKAA